ncbi:hypothetical protein [Mucilaginibacter sp. 44-25]|uniref:hypothetical protein n=1 Tax=Mucilaginibacter sp. 44-25 TaxID=1895794 RepID=UPI000961EFB0|nr:hypothetical protein [Mucilaginibacter sp. 44-25]OJW17964.1 MAG: hypothetical protein BGO48_15390 [Mucilaginibacter sp. 44-25]
MSTEDFLKENNLTDDNISVRFKVINEDSELQDGDILADFTEDGDVNLTKIGGNGKKPEPKNGNGSRGEGGGPGNASRLLNDENQGAIRVRLN